VCYLDRVLPRLLLLALLTSACGVDYEAHTLAWDDRLGSEGTLDAYVPIGAERNRPAVLLLHMGGWNEGDKSLLNTEANRLARAGYVVGNANYRLAPKVHFPTHVLDARCALSFMRSHADELHLDPKRIAMLGYSAGGNLAEMLGVGGPLPGTDDCPSGPTDAPAAVIAGAGPADLLELSALGDPALEQYLGATKAEARSLYEAASPLLRVPTHAPPFLLVHGTGDVYVPWEQSRNLRDTLIARGNDAKLLLIEGGGHTFNSGAEPGAGDYGELAIDSPEAWPVILDFLERNLGAPP
jgi:acetyl esterase/lipase